MAHRVGVCGSCQARFQIPSTFTPNRARCRTCGGVVEIGPPEGTAAPPPDPGVVSPAAAIAAPRAPELSAAPQPAPPPSSPPAPQPAPKERSVLVPILVAAGAIALLALGAWQLFGGGKSAPPPGDRDGAPAANPPR